MSVHAGTLPESTANGGPRTLLTRCRAYPRQPLQSDAWRPLGRRFGGVTLAGHPGAVATVEATWVPLASGSLPVPVLSLQASSGLGAGWGQLWGGEQSAETLGLGVGWHLGLARCLAKVSPCKQCSELVPTDGLTCT